MSEEKIKMFYVKNLLNERVLTVSGSDPGPSSTVVAAPQLPGEMPSQIWYLERYIQNRTFLRSSLGKNLVLDIKGNNGNPNASLIVWPRKSSNMDNQTWFRISSPPNPGFIQFFSWLNTELVITVDNNTSAPGTAVSMQPDQGQSSESQLWTLEEV